MTRHNRNFSFDEETYNMMKELTDLNLSAYIRKCIRALYHNTVTAAEENAAKQHAEYLAFTKVEVEF